MSIKPYWKDLARGLVVYHGDCADLLRELVADVVLTDPPYNAKKRYGAHTNDARPWDEWAAWLDDRLDLMAASAPDLFVFLSQTAYRHYCRYGRRDIAWSAVWTKPLAMAACAAMFMPHWEHLAYFGDRRYDYRTPARIGGKWGSDWFVCGDDVFECNVEVGKSRHGHQTPKPLQLMRQIVRRFPPGTRFLDPFAGVGTTGQACAIEGYPCVSVEIEEAYCETIARRLALGEAAAQRPQQGVLNLDLEAS